MYKNNYNEMIQKKLDKLLRMEIKNKPITGEDEQPTYFSGKGGFAKGTLNDLGFSNEKTNGVSGSGIPNNLKMAHLNTGSKKYIPTMVKDLGKGNVIGCGRTKDQNPSFLGPGMEMEKVGGSILGPIDYWPFVYDKMGNKRNSDEKKLEKIDKELEKEEGKQITGEGKKKMLKNKMIKTEILGEGKKKMAKGNMSRQQLIKKLMGSGTMSMIDASKYIKKNNLY